MVRKEQEALYCVYERSLMGHLAGSVGSLQLLISGL